MSSLVTVMLVDNQFLGDFYFTKDPVETAKNLLQNNWYTKSGDFYLNEDGESAAEDIFDMTNNPSRQYEREKYYGRKRPVSVGDIVDVEGVKYLCCKTGWKAI